jgi:hypothetical protein
MKLNTPRTTEKGSPSPINEMAKDGSCVPCGLLQFADVHW